MPDLAISIDSLSKRYELGLTHAGSVRELVNGAARRLLRRDTNPASADTAGTSDQVERTGDGRPAFWALRDISFDIAQGEVVGLIGKNGAGKSTLLKLLSRITRPTSGRAVLRGRVASLLEVGTGFHPELTGRENVYLNGTILGMTRREVDRRFDDIVDFAGVAKFIDTPVKRYSSGMTVRLGFAVAAHLDPEVLIVDEVLAVGDVEFQRKCLGKMREAATSGRTVLFVSHNLSSVRSLTSRSVVLSKGRVDFIGRTPDALERYVSLNSGQRAAGDVTDRERPFDGLGVAARMTELSLAETEIAPGEALQIRLGVTAAADRRLDPFAVGMTLFRSDETAVGSCFSGPLDPPQPGQTQTYRLQMPAPPLAPGEYYAAISLATADGRYDLIDSLGEVLPFEVHQAVFGQQQWQAGWGAVRLPDLHATAVAGNP